MMDRPLVIRGALGAAFFISLALFLPSRAEAAAYTLPKRHQATGELVTQTFTKDKSPYVLFGGCNVNRLYRGQTLTIEAGVVVKFAFESGCGPGISQLLAYGNLVVNGTENDPVIFTSWHDDTAGGDTNGNGNATVPQAGDWLRVQAGEAGVAGKTQTTRIEHLVVRYATTPLLLQPSSDPSVAPFTGLTVMNNIFPMTTAVPVVITNSRFLNNSNGALSATGGQVDARNNWWGHGSGPTVASNPGGTGQKIVGDILYDPWIGKAPTHDPVILIPGILGTEMKKGSETLWLNLFRIFDNPGDEFLDPLRLKDDASAFDPSVILGDTLRLKGIPAIGLSFDYFQGLIDEFELKGYQENTDLFVFPYDWRLPIETNSQKLKEKIDEILASRPGQKVDLVAHSMGGLLAKHYLFQHPDAKVDALIYLGTPHLGAPKAAKALVFGDGFDIPFLNVLEMKKLAMNMPSVYQLLPSRSYIGALGAYIYDLVEQKILGYGETKEYLVENGGNSALADAGDAFHSAPFDAFGPAGVKTYAVSGCNTPTMNTIVKRNEGEYYLGFSAGDGTVPLGSSDAVGIPTANRFYVKKTNHGKMPSEDGIRQLVANLAANGQSGALPSRITQDKTACAVSGKYISVHSPVDIKIVDAFGNRAGREATGDILNNIGGLSYETIGEEKFVFLPDGQTYTVTLTGTGNGTFHLRAAQVVNNAIVGTAYYNDVRILNGQTGALTLGGTSADTVLRLDDGTGKLTVVPQSAVLDADDSLDTGKPATALLVNGAPAQHTWYRTPLVSLSATDDNSGVLKTEYSLDNGATWHKYAGALTAIPEGASTILYFSTDRAGNREPVRDANIKVDNTAPEATFEFRQKNPDMVIGGADEQSNVVVWNYGDYVGITDQAGNETRVYATRTIRARSGGATVTKITQNGVITHAAPASSIRSVWNLDAAGRITLLQQQVTKNSANLINMSYQRATGKTTVRILDRPSFTVPGMPILKLQTKKGDFIYNY